MAKASPIQSSVNSGELSPLLDARTDFAKYGTGASIMENFLPTVQGPLVRRAGTRFVREAGGSEKVLFVPFEFSVTQAYVIEFRPFFIRFYTTDSVTKVRGVLESSPGTVLQILSPYEATDLFSADGTPRLKFAQSGDFLYITSGNHQTRILKRTSATNFTLTLHEVEGGPFKILNDTTTTVFASAEAGTGVTLTASAGIFAAGHVGSLFQLESKDINAIPAWEVGKVIAVGARRRSDGKTYEALNGATTGTNRPVHTEGALFDGDVGVQWQFRDPGYGYVKITSVDSSTQATVTVVDRLPSQVVLAANATTRWAFGAWSTVEGWPTAVAFFRERLWLAKKQMVWGSVAADFNDFRARNFGQVTADAAIVVTLVSGKINDVQWMTGDDELLCGTAGGEFVIGELTNGNPIGPGNVRSRLISQYGSRSIPPIKNGNGQLFIQRAGLKAREISYDSLNLKYASTDATILANHITRSGVVNVAFTQEPVPVVWVLLADGSLIGYTWSAEQDVRAWHRHPVGGNGFVESMAVIPAIEGDRDELWLCVRRVINGTIVRYVEYMERPWREGDLQSSSFYVDSGLSYKGAATTTISGLSHLNGQVVDVLVNGAAHPQRTVSGGFITLQIPATVAHVGLPCPAKFRSMRIEAGAKDGTSQGKTKRIHKMVYRFINTAGGKYGSSVENLDTLQFREASDPMDQPVPLYSGDKVVSWPDGYTTDGYIMYVNDQPLPVTLLAVMPQVVTNDAR